MSDVRAAPLLAPTHEKLIERLSRDLRPTGRLLPPWQRVLLWLAAASWVGLLVALFADWDTFRQRLGGAPDMWLGELGAVLTAVSAGWAALQTAVPGRSAAWALLPVPPAAVWAGASAAGCLRLRPIGGVVPEPAMHPVSCAEFLLLVALPLSALLGWLLVRACPPRPALTCVLAGLASGAGAAALLALCHPFDATAEDLGMHFLVVAGVMAGMRVWGARALR